MKKISKSNVIAGVAVFLLIVTNPLVAVHVETGIQWVFDQIIQNSGIVMALCLAYLVGLMIVRDMKQNRLKVPKNGSSVKKSGLKYEVSKATN